VEGIGVNQEKILRILQESDDKKLDYNDLLEVFKQETGKPKGQFDRALIALEGKDVLYRENGFICLK
jgi:hypothetical protein